MRPGRTWSASIVRVGLMLCAALASCGGDRVTGPRPIPIFPPDPSGNWSQTAGPEGGPVTAFATLGSNLFAGTSGGGVFRSTNNGASWTGTGLTGHTISALAASGSNVVARIGTGVFLSTNNGTSWTNIGLTNLTVLDLAIIGNSLFAGTDGAGVWRSSL